MSSSVPPVPNYVYVMIRFNMAESVNSLVGKTLLYYYMETNDVFPIVGLVQSDETLMAEAIRHCGHLVNFRIEHNDRLYIAEVLDGLMDHESDKTSILINDLLYGRLKWIARHHTLALVVAVTDSVNEVVVAIDKLP